MFTGSTDNLLDEHGLRQLATLVETIDDEGALSIAVALLVGEGERVGGVGAEDARTLVSRPTCAELSERLGPRARARKEHVVPTRSGKRGVPAKRYAHAQRRAIRHGCTVLVGHGFLELGPENERAPGGHRMDHFGAIYWHELPRELRFTLPQWADCSPGWLAGTVWLTSICRDAAELRPITSKVGLRAFRDLAAAGGSLTLTREEMATRWGVHRDVILRTGTYGHYGSPCALGELCQHGYFDVVEAERKKGSRARRWTITTRLYGDLRAETDAPTSIGDTSSSEPAPVPTTEPDEYTFSAEDEAMIDEGFKRAFEEEFGIAGARETASQYVVAPPVIKEEKNGQLTIGLAAPDTRARDEAATNSPAPGPGAEMHSVEKVDAAGAVAPAVDPAPTTEVKPILIAVTEAQLDNCDYTRELRAGLHAFPGDVPVELSVTGEDATGHKLELRREPLLESNDRGEPMRVDPVAYRDAISALLTRLRGEWDRNQRWEHVKARHAADEQDDDDDGDDDREETGTAVAA